jgi:hypothetical protein
MDCTPRTACRLCKHDVLSPALDLGSTPLANEYWTEAEYREATTQQEMFPLGLVLCAKCGHLQLSHIVSSERMFRHYKYATGVGKGMVRHFQEAARFHIDLLVLDQSYLSPLVVSVGGNDGSELVPYRDAQDCESPIRVLNVDPAEEIGQAARAAGIPTMTEFFNLDTAKAIRAAHGQADLILANNVFVHTPDPGAIVAGVAELLAPNGLFTFEVAYIGDMVDAADLSSVYHEHDGYGALLPFVKFFAAHNLCVVGFDSITTHGGSIRVHVSKAFDSQHPDVLQRCLDEIDAGLFAPGTYASVGERFIENGNVVKAMLEGHHWAAANGGSDPTILVYGCPAKLTTMMYAWNMSAQKFAAVVDDSPWKQGLRTPGLHIPIISAAQAREKHPSPAAILIGASNLSALLVEQLRAQGFKCPIVTPLPAVTVDR